ncbi:DNA phosphorothioation-associated protein 4 [Streptomyces sp. DSM 41527]|uniref:DNA phosphorothioation-associated protein 4 n=1 Tax=Streptomyces mooreae TaxID=3075523 RepID=A0ABU2T7W9_9ACTN|nr:DNA phosphorothioation-associated protein 4 [Streptomyces sp. DSM 41527]MDT0457006.1 DNA phosphorothioation-associated protein 4 [Streptomyces sp. DSM 41527]
MAAVDRFRRPSTYEKLLVELTEKKTGPFGTLVEAMMFAAVLGRRKGRREPFEQHDEPIRLALMEGRLYGDVLLDMLAAVEEENDPKILADDRLPDRILIFEEYANGGLGYLQAEINRQLNEDLDAIVAALIIEALQAPQETGEDDIGHLLTSASLNW